MPLSLDIKSIGDTSASLTLDLIDYLLITDKDGRDKQLYQTWREDCRETLADFGKEILWENIFDIIINDRFLSSEIDELKKSPFYEIMNNSFGELLANSIDQTIDRYYYAIENKQAPNCQLFMRLDLDSDNLETLSFTIQDNAGGFSPEFLNKMQTQEQQIAYSEQKTTSKKTRESYRVAHMGGRGLGIKQLLKEIYKDANEDESTTLPVHFSNHLELGNSTGAVINITLPRIAPTLHEQYYSSPDVWLDDLSIDESFTSIATTGEDRSLSQSSSERSTETPRTQSAASTLCISPASTTSSKKSGGLGFFIDTDTVGEKITSATKHPLSPQSKVGSPITSKASRKPVAQSNIDTLRQSFPPLNPMTPTIDHTTTKTTAYKSHLQAITNTTSSTKPPDIGRKDPGVK